MSTSASRRLAVALMAAAGLAMLTLGAVSVASNQMTALEAAGWLAAIVTGTAGAWLYSARGRRP